MWRDDFVSHCHGLVHDFMAGRTLTVLVVSLVVVLAYVGMRGYRYQLNVWRGRERRRVARQSLQDLKDNLKHRDLTEGVDRERDAMIVGLSFPELRDTLQKGELTALQVLRAYQKKALAVNDKLNCITEPIVEAEARARELDKLKPKQRGPLHGIPVSLKDSVFLKDYDCHVGHSCLIGKHVSKNADIVELYKQLGAVPFMRTNVPQGLISMACSNPIYGRTKNPYDPERGPGGSSGGEGALIGGGGSILGIGSDIGGSIRIPANMCGVYALKPTVDRFLNKGHSSLLRGQTAIRTTMGPMARDMQGLIEVTRALYTGSLMNDIDPLVPPCPFNDMLLEKKGGLRIGFYTTIEGVTPHPACVRAVMEAKAALERQGYQLVPFTPHGAIDAFTVLETKALFAGFVACLKHMMKDDTLDKCTSTFYYGGILPKKLQYIIFKLKAFQDPLTSKMALSMYRVPVTVADWWKLIGKIMDFKEEFYAAWKREKLDAILCPTLPYPPLLAGTEEVCAYSVVYTGLYNVLNYPAGSVPVTKVRQQDVQALMDPATYPRTGFFEKFIVKNFEGAKGIPVGVQVVALPFQEEMVLRVMRDVDNDLNQ